MDNIIDKTLTKILKMARTLSIFKTLLYLVGGILILAFNERIEDYIYLIVGVDLIATASLEFAEEIVRRKYKRHHNHLGNALFTIIAGILILSIFHNDIYKVSVIWATATIVNSTIEINEGLHEIRERKAFSTINLVFAIVEIVFSILLLIEPEENAEHFLTHIYLLGAGFVLESIEELFIIFAPYIFKNWKIEITTKEEVYIEKNEPLNKENNVDDNSNNNLENNTEKKLW